MLSARPSAARQVTQRSTATPCCLGAVFGKLYVEVVLIVIVGVCPARPGGGGKLLRLVIHAGLNQISTLGPWQLRERKKKKIKSVQRRPLYSLFDFYWF